jgi:hypothetical protein
LAEVDKQLGTRFIIFDIKQFFIGLVVAATTLLSNTTHIERCMLSHYVTSA